MFVLRVKTEQGWKDVQMIWEDEVGLCYMPTQENPAEFDDIGDAETAANDLSAECQVIAGVFDRTAGVLVYSVSPRGQ